MPEQVPRQGSIGGAQSQRGEKRGDRHLRAAMNRRDPVPTSSIFSWPYNRRDRIIDPASRVEKVSANNGPCLIKRTLRVILEVRAAIRVRRRDNHGRPRDSRHGIEGSLGRGLIGLGTSDKSRRRSRDYRRFIYLVEMIEPMLGGLR